MTETGATSREEPPTPSFLSRRSLLIIAGGVGVGAAVGAAAGFRIGASPSGMTLEMLPSDALGSIQRTLSPGPATGLLEQARQCREPLARIAVWHSPNTRGGELSVRSGSYQSPRFALTPTPQLIALPYPNPYPTGRGILTLLGEADEVIVALTPRKVAILKGTIVIPVVWSTTEHCR